MATEALSPRPAHPPKLARLPPSQKIQKRPLLHAPVASGKKSSTTQKIIYVSAKTPFISTVKRVRAYLEEIEKRAAGSLSVRGGERGLLRAIEAGVSGKFESNGEVVNARQEEVLIKGTGKAIEKVVRMAAWWMSQTDVVVVVRTGSVGAVDDIVSREAGGADEEEQGSRVRRVSCLEVGIHLK
ncbi:hypothetical protein BUE80_DR012702 [Diplocarpon rosae]|nr:hypothetical protein BUE80_DR012702 [Diplocarpon rosae]